MLQTLFKLDDTLVIFTWDLVSGKAYSGVPSIQSEISYCAKHRFIRLSLGAKFKQTTNLLANFN